jgi:hypothetical protein
MKCFLIHNNPFYTSVLDNDLGQVLYQSILWFQHWTAHQQEIRAGTFSLTCRTFRKAVGRRLGAAQKTLSSSFLKGVSSGGSISAF